jgi:hypothetical protein
LAIILSAQAATASIANENYVGAVCSAVVQHKRKNLAKAFSRSFPWGFPDARMPAISSESGSGNWVARLVASQLLKVLPALVESARAALRLSCACSNATAASRPATGCG